MLKCASFFAGVGGIDIGFEQNDLFKVVYANEIDPYPVKTYELNSDIKVDCRDIHDVHVDEIEDFDVMLAGFPCQAFSVAGYRKGFEDEKGRGTLFFELLRIIKAKQPEIVFLENVKNLVCRQSHFDTGSRPDGMDHGLHKLQWVDFAQALATGGRPFSDAREGRKTVEIVEAIYHAAKTGEKVYLDR